MASNNPRTINFRYAAEDVLLSGVGGGAIAGAVIGGAALLIASVASGGVVGLIAAGFAGKALAAGTVGALAFLGKAAAVGAVAGVTGRMYEINDIGTTYSLPDYEAAGKRWMPRSTWTGAAIGFLIGGVPGAFIGAGLYRTHRWLANKM